MDLRIPSWVRVSYRMKECLGTDTEVLFSSFQSISVVSLGDNGIQWAMTAVRLCPCAAESRWCYSTTIPTSAEILDHYTITLKIPHMLWSRLPVRLLQRARLEAVLSYLTISCICCQQQGCLWVDANIANKCYTVFAHSFIQHSITTIIICHKQSKILSTPHHTVL